jgi:hypothetical protein
MHTPVDERLRLEAERFAFRFSCEHCAYYDPDGLACSEGYPNEPHRSAELSNRSLLVFCKSFELS